MERLYINQIKSFLKGRFHEENERKFILSMLLLRFAGLEFEKECAELKSEGWRYEDQASWEGKSIYFPRGVRWEALEKREGQDLRKGLYDAFRLMDVPGSKYRGLVYPKSVTGSFDEDELAGLFHITGELSFGRHGEEGSDFSQLYEFMLQYLTDWSIKQMGSYCTPRQIARLMVGLLEPEGGIIYDPCCGSGSMLLCAADYMRSKKQNYGLYGQEADETAWKMARINLILRGEEADLGSAAADALQYDLHGELQADVVLANPPFQRHGRGQGRISDDVPWKPGFPAAQKGDFVWLQHMLSHLKENGRIASVFSNGILAGQRREEREFRAALLREDLVEAVFTLPPGLFYTTKAAVSLWVLKKDKESVCRKRILFVDARKLGKAEGGLTVFSDLEREELVSAYRNYQNGIQDDRPGFCRQVPVTEIEADEYSMAPERYVMDRRQKLLKLEELESREAELEGRLKELLGKNRDMLNLILNGK
ncbi:MAG: N-6 DNA methylase [Lachnospiraceae bacterium]|nr:N-6 DNA methylase [Lachnospiraceae bacterium]